MAEAVKVKSKSGQEAVREFLKGKPARTGAQLVKALRLSGTPEAKLRPARDRLAEARAAGRRVAADEIVGVLRETAPEATVRKAEQLALDGTFTSLRRKQQTIEEEMLAEEEAEDRPAAKK